MLDTQLLIQARMQRLLRTALDYARVRAELLEVEFNAERERLGSMLYRALLLSLAVLTTLQLGAALLIALSWNTRWRLPVLLGLLLSAVVASLLAWQALRRLRRARPSRPLAAAFREFDRLLKPLDDELG
ncbi:Putative Holin-X, holin superfamily III [Solimonas aquatica]|uniref:Putative Holin-X, holin superfamily III n=1 Tax=Solimonas aquatica TaxID=489703 RepID=A0A1H9ADN3_9GAMM|nr:phage holin family protein [Solimonas aquatica]SEP74617.1 Putative Holin-X, holin superfamily III [Solimonas aquatica]